MKIHEYQAMKLFKDYGIETVRCQLTETADDVPDIAKSLGGRVVVKAQVLVGGRGKAGGVKLARSAEEAVRLAQEILSMQISANPVKKVLIAQAVDIRKEYYLGVTIDRARKSIVFVASASGGVEIEELAVKSPEAIQRLYVAALKEPQPKELQQLTLKVFGDAVSSEKAAETMHKMYRLFVEKDCSLVEINPYVKTAADQLVAVDAKINFDDNGLFKHPDIEALKNPEEYSEAEIRAKAAGLSFVSMEGNIGCIVNGAGLAMATMDMIKLFGGEPANFLDVGGSSNPNKVLEALNIILSNGKVKAVLINIFGGITRCDDIAQGIIMAKEKIDIKVPLVIRLIGTKEKEGRELLKSKGIVVAEEMTEAVRRVVALV